MMEDNESTAKIVTAGYSKRLRHLKRTHKVNIASINEPIGKKLELHHRADHPKAVHKSVGSSQWHDQRSRSSGHFAVPSPNRHVCCCVLSMLHVVFVPTGNQDLTLVCHLYTILTYDMLFTTYLDTSF